MSKAEDFSVRDGIAFSADAVTRSKFWSHVDKTDSCWLYRKTTGYGYGYIWIGGKRCGASRVSLVWALGPPAAGLYACHKCLNRNCVRPDHLYFGTFAENMADKRRDGTHLEGDRNPRSLISNETAKAIHAALDGTRKSYRLVAAQFSVSASVVASIAQGRNWKAILPQKPDRTQRAQTTFPTGRNPRAHLDDETAKQIWCLLAEGHGVKQTAEKFKVSIGVVMNLKKGKNYAFLRSTGRPCPVVRPTRKRLDEKKIALIKQGLAQVADQRGGNRLLASRFGVSESTISQIKSGTIYRTRSK